jgi:hypothetical protein
MAWGSLAKSALGADGRPSLRDGGLDFYGLPRIRTVKRGVIACKAIKSAISTANIGNKKKARLEGRADKDWRPFPSTKKTLLREAESPKYSGTAQANYQHSSQSSIPRLSILILLRWRLLFFHIVCCGNCATHGS